jgi:AcrR family transcriptional regulator
MAETSRQEQKNRTRSLLVTAGLDLFARRGLSFARTADIAASAGVSHGTVFVHFPTREDLLAAATEEFGTRVTRRIHELAEGGKRVRDLLAAHIECLIEFEPFYTRFVIEESALPARVKNTLVMIQSSVAFHLSRAVEAETVAGAIRKMPFHLFFNTWLGLIHYYIAHAASFAPAESVLKRHGHELLEHFVGLISRHDEGGEK